jgi:hypothetical protein
VGKGDLVYEAFRPEILVMKFEVKIDIAGVTSEITKVASKVVREAAFLIKQKMLFSFSQPKSGRTYRRGSRVHVASAPGEAPAIDTGFLANSIQTEFPDATTGIVTVGAEYAQVLEEVLDRPFVKPSIEDVVSELNRGGIIADLNS